MSAAVLRGNTVLLVQRAKPLLRGIWSLPGGHLEPGERAIEGAAREVLEETGVTASLAGLLDMHDVILRDPASGELKVHYMLAVYYGTWVAGEPKAGSDVSDARFVPMSEVGRYRLTEGAEGVIARAERLLARA